jgi:hypothetical protein
MMRKYHVRFGGGWTEKVHASDGSRRRPWNLAGRLPYIIWGFQYVAGFRRRHVGASIQDAWTSSLEGVRAALDADTARERSVLLGATTRELGPTREAVIDTAVRRIDLPHKQAVDAYDLAERHETNPRSVWGYVQGLTRLSQRTSWQDGRFALERAASRLLTTVN